MMNSNQPFLSPYLNFNGNCEEAVKFYCTTLEGQVQFKMTFKEAKMKDITPDLENKICHIKFTLRGTTLMASDCPPQHGAKFGDNIHLSLSFAPNENIEDM